MKKTLIALAVLAASGASMAQVTLYGVVDLALGYNNLPAPATGVNPNNWSLRGNDIYNDGNSRWGIKSVEDLGGGLKFTAQFEQNINYEGGSVGATNARYAYGALAGNFGEIRLGRTLTPTFFGVATWELTGAANFSAVANMFGFAGAGPRNDSQMSYTTPNLGGFTGTLGYVTEQDNGINTGAGPASSKIDANAIYAQGPLSIGASYWKLDKVATGQSTDGNYSIGANYNFGSFILAGSFQDPAGQGQGWTLGARVPVGAWAFTVDVAQDTAYSQTNWLAYAGYSLSKRTTLYTNYQRYGKVGDLTKPTRSYTANNSGNDIDVYALGIRHNF